MNLIKQVLLLKQQGKSNREIGRLLPINKGTVNSYMNTIKLNGWGLKELLLMDDPELERMFHAGSPAYSDPRMRDFLEQLPYYRQQLTDPKLHVNRNVLWEEYKASHPNGYGKSQFYYHLKQNLIAQKDTKTVLTGTYRPGEKLMIDFAGDKLHYVDTETGEMVATEVFVACMPYSDYTFVTCVRSQRTEDLIHAIRMCLEHLGGVPPIITLDNLKAAVISNDRHEPKINKALEDMGNHYHFVVLPCDPHKPTQKALVEDKVRVTYNRVYAKLRNRTFLSLIELNRAVEELVGQHNKTRMQKRPYSREERFHAMEKDLLKPLPDTIYEMKYYARLQVQNSCFVELRHDGVTHFYSAPYIYVGRQARVIFTRSTVSIYIDGGKVASHRRKYEYGYTYEKEHLPSNSMVVLSRSSGYYITRARHISPTCGSYVAEVFNPERTRQPEEVYFKLCDAILSLCRRYDTATMDLTCRQCLEMRIFSYKKFEMILKRNALMAAEDEPAFDTPTPTNHENMRGREYFR